MSDLKARFQFEASDLGEPLTMEDPTGEFAHLLTCFDLLSDPESEEGLPRRDDVSVRLLAPIGNFPLMGGVYWSANIQKTLPDAELIEPRFRVRSSRRLTMKAAELASDDPDLLVIGAGFQDWLIATEFGLPAIDIDEFRPRMFWSAKLFCEILQIPTVFLFCPPCEEGSEVAPGLGYFEELACHYLGCLEDIAATYENFRIFDARPSLPAPDQLERGEDGLPTKESLRPARSSFMKRLGAFMSEVASGRAPRKTAQPASVEREFPTCFDPDTLDNGASLARLVVSPQFAVPLRVGVSNGSEVRISDQVHARLLYFTIPSGEGVGPDEGASMKGKSLGIIGGRNIFEKSLQFNICSYVWSRHRPGLRRAMVIGDSIRMMLREASGHGIYAYQHLVDKVNLIHVPHNCGGTNVGRAFMDSWLHPKPEVVFYNAGLHDLALRPVPSTPPPGSYNTVEDYQENLRILFGMILGSGVKTLIWGLSHCCPNYPGKRILDRLSP